MSKFISKRHLSRLVRNEKEKKLLDLRNSSIIYTHGTDTEVRGSTNPQNVNTFQEVGEMRALRKAHEDSNSFTLSQNDHYETTSEIPVTVNEKLKYWYIKYQPSRESFEALLKILKSENLDVQLSSKSVISKTKTIIRDVSPGQYCHFGLKFQLLKIAHIIIKYHEIHVCVGIDGLPLYKSSAQSLWPILCNLLNVDNIKVIVADTYLGKKKPYNVDTFLRDFIEELCDLINNVLVISNKTIKFKVISFICDAPARAFVCGTVGHNSLVGCSKCTQIGEKIDGVTTFVTKAANRRTDDEFLKRKHCSYHIPFYRNRKSLLENLGIGMVTQFPLDCMHVIDLSVTRKIILRLLHGKSLQKLTTENKYKISENLLSFSRYIPKEFARKPRSLDEILKWKSTEFRQFLLYTSILALKDIVSEDIYYHFLLLHCAYRLLLCSKNFKENIQTAEEMLKYFVEYFPNLYGRNSVTYNVHSLLHIADCVRENGFLQDFSAYTFENFLQHLKKKIKKPTKILQQLHRKIQNDDLLLQKPKVLGFRKDCHGNIKSHQSSMHFLSLTERNNYCCIRPYIPIQITGYVEKDEDLIIGKRLLNIRNFYVEPIQSTTLGICLTDKKTKDGEETIKIKEVFCKLMCLHFQNDFLIITFLHECI